MPLLDEEKLLISDLWLDQPDAGERIEVKLHCGGITAQQAETLSKFVRDGYLTFHIHQDSVLDSLEEEINQLWRQRPVDLAFAYDGPLTSMAEADEEIHRKPGYRIADLHSHSLAAQTLYLEAEIRKWVDLVFDHRSVAFQSLYFQFGSQQSFHRDPVYVVTTPPSHLLAAWIALEDIGPGCGPLSYIPGSHKIPYFEFEEDRISLGPR